MALYLLDTSIVTLLFRQHQQVQQSFVSHASDTIAINTITAEETIGGWLALIRRSKTKLQVAQASQSFADAIHFMSRFSILPPTELILHRYESLARLKLNVGSMDLKIAAIGLEHDGIIVTQNVRDFQRVPNLKWEDWSQ